MKTRKLKISILAIALMALPFIFGGCFLDELFSCTIAMEYSVTYELGADDAKFIDGEKNPDSYWTDVSTHLYSPRRDGYVFRGWYDNPDFDGTVWNSIPKGTRGDITLYAKWGEAGDAVFWEGFLPYKDKFDDAESGSRMTINSRDELSAYLEYIQYYYIKADKDTSVRIELAYTEASAQDEISTLHTSLSYGTYVGLRYSTGTPAFVGILYDNLITGEASRTAASKGYYTQIQPYEYITAGSEHKFAIDKAETELACSTSNQLFYAAQVGAKPVPASGSSAERMYSSAKKALTEAVNEDMTDAEKVTAIYDWLIMNVTYDYDALKYTDVQVAAEYDAFYLEGVFDTGRAVCDGISKAFTLMCRMEGIPCVRVIGDGHAWNKVFVDGTWYIADATFGDTGIELDRTNYSFMTHQYLLTTEYTIASGIGGRQISYREKAENYLDENYYALSDYGYYRKKKFFVDDKEYDFVISSKAEYNTLYNWAKSLGHKGPYSVDFYTESRDYLGSGKYTTGNNYVTLFFNV